MASPPANDDIFAQLRKPVDPKELERREKEIGERVFAASEKAEKRQHELITLNSGAPITISSVRVLHANHTRHAFLARLLDPILSHNRTDDASPYTLSEALSTISATVSQLHRLDIFHPPISTYIDRADPTDASSTPHDHTVFISARERGRYTIKTGTEAGSAEGSAYLSLVLRNLFGGGERLSGNASVGTRTRDAYAATFDTPVRATPDLRWELAAHRSTVHQAWASHEEARAGAATRLIWAPTSAPASRHELGYGGVRRTVGAGAGASPSVRADAGESFKEAFAYAFTRDARDVPMLPTRGTLLKTVAELAGWGPLSGDVAFGKLEVESQAAVPVPIPGIKGESGVAFTLGLRGGVLAPLPLLRGGKEEGVAPSRINDRFQLGGPTDVRGFRLSGLGPRDGPDAVGGDVYAAGSAALLMPFPRLGKETPLRFQAFVNGGRLLALRDTRVDKSEPMRLGDVGSGLARTFEDLTGSLPSAAAGFGIVYAHPAARVEVNFSLPLVIRKGEEGRKGLSFGIGLNFM